MENKIAVITGDLIDSSLHEDELLNRVLDILKKEFEEIHQRHDFQKANFNLFRGDSFQGIVEDSSETLRVALQIKTAVNQVHFREVTKSRSYSKVADLRMALGIGHRNFSAIGFLIAAKSILRFNDKVKIGARKQTEYVLIGTSMSFAITIILGLLVDYIAFQ